MEAAWLDRMRTTTLYRYDFDASAFERWPEASGQWVAREPVVPVGRATLTDLLGLHAEAGIELRVVPSLWPVYDVAVSALWDFSIVRMRNAAPRPS